MNLNAIYYSFPKWRSGSFNSVSLFNPVQTTISLYQPAYCPFITRQPMQSALCNRGVIEGLGQDAYTTPPGAQHGRKPDLEIPPDLHSKLTKT